VFPLGVDGGGVGDDQRERETLAGFCPRATLFPSTPNRKRQEEEGFGDLQNPEKILAGLFPPLGRFCKRRIGQGER
jgi:hypothetical protein